jgi:hypothetical protein
VGTEVPHAPDPTVFAEARVFERGSNPTINGVLDTIQVQSKDDARAIALLERSDVE